MRNVQLLELDVAADPSVLLRIVGVCHQRAIAISSLHYESASGRVLLGLTGDTVASGRAALWLDAIIPVLAVRTSQGQAGPRLTRLIAADATARQSPPPLGTLAP